MRFILYAIFVHVSSVICLNENENSNQDVVQGRYSFNHPPGVEDYNPIAVSVAYKDDAIIGKIIEPDFEEGFTQRADTNIEEEPLATKANEKAKATNTAFTKSLTDSKQEIALRPKARAMSDLQIPVAVVYDSTTSENIRNLQPTNSSSTNSNRRKYKQIRRRKQQNTTGSINEKPVVQNAEPVTPKIETVDYNKPETKYIDSLRPKPRKIEYTKPESEYKSIQNVADTYTKSVPRKRVHDAVVPIINSENYVFSHSGNFHYSYEGGDGTRAHSEGQLTRSDNGKSAGEAVSGGFSYTDKDGNDFSLSYTADENGYRPIGAHLPTPPPIPPAIARALAYLATATTPEPVTQPSVKQATRV